MTAEIVAKKCEISKWEVIILELIVAVILAFFIVCTVLSALAYSKETLDSFIPLIFSIVFDVIFVFTLIYDICKYLKYRKIPEVLITYEDGKFDFADGFSCVTADVVNITGRRARGGRYGTVKLSWGKIIIDLIGKQIKLNYVENVDKVVFRLNEYIKANRSEQDLQQGNNNG